MNSISSVNKHGFSLLEVMIALAIIGTALTACLTLVNRCVHSHEQVQRITIATMLAQHKMSELEVAARHNELDSIEKQGIWEKPYGQYRWQVVYTDTPINGVQQVNVSIIWGDRKNNEEVSIDSFLFNK
ncbi:MAG: hypothetical protein B6I36_08900 [Desulfobacteraceae bacterium 4572_35.1]|nr:MAG: hypothetical protein B6I36_08900 [Desulfobacteraceae bacterium 4572_35.1]